MSEEKRDERGEVYAIVLDSPEAIARWRIEKHRQFCVCNGTLRACSEAARRTA